MSTIQRTFHSAGTGGVGGTASRQVLPPPIPEGVDEKNSFQILASALASTMHSKIRVLNQQLAIFNSGSVGKTLTGSVWMSYPNQHGWSNWVKLFDGTTNKQTAGGGIWGEQNGTGIYLNGFGSNIQVNPRAVLLFDLKTQDQKQVSSANTEISRANASDLAQLDRTDDGQIIEESQPAVVANSPDERLLLAKKITDGYTTEQLAEDLSKENLEKLIPPELQGRPLQIKFVKYPPHVDSISILYEGDFNEYKVCSCRGPNIKFTSVSTDDWKRLQEGSSIRVTVKPKESA